MARLPLILLPGLLCDARLWRHQTEHLSDIADVRVPDLTGADSLGALAAGVLDEAPAEFALAGLSMGGYVAQEIMRRAPERVLRLAFVDTTARADTEEQRARRRGLIELAQKGEFHGVTDRLLPLLVAEARLRDKALTDIVKDMARTVGRDAFLRQQAAIMGRPDGRGDLGKIRCPTLVLYGREDALAPPEIHREMAEGIPSAKLVVIEECGHLAPLEQPIAATAVLRYWLQA